VVPLSSPHPVTTSTHHRSTRRRPAWLFSFLLLPGLHSPRPCRVAGPSATVLAKILSCTTSLPFVRVGPEPPRLTSARVLLLRPHATRRLHLLRRARATRSMRPHHQLSLLSAPLPNRRAVSTVLRSNSCSPNAREPAPSARLKPSASLLRSAHARHPRARNFPAQRRQLLPFQRCAVRSARSSARSSQPPLNCVCTRLLPACRNSSRALRSSACLRRQLGARSRRLLRARAATLAHFRTRVCFMPPKPRAHVSAT
jgi:hypothetical protein